MHRTLHETVSDLLQTSHRLLEISFILQHHTPSLQQRALSMGLTVIGATEAIKQFTEKQLTIYKLQVKLFT